MLYAVAGGAVLVLLVLIVTYSKPRIPLLFLVGVSAGLERAQIHKVHVFVIATILLVLFGRRPDGFRWSRRGFLIPLAVAVLCISVPLGTLVNSHLLQYQLLLLAGTATLIAATALPDELSTVLAGLLAIVTVGSLAALLQYVHLLPFTLYQGEARPIGIYSEPDYLGLYSAIGIVLALRAPYKFGTRFCLVTISAAACVLAEARAAWLAVVVASAAALLTSSEARARFARRKGNARIIGTLLVIGVLIFAVDGSLRNLVVTRLVNVTSSSNAIDTGASRANEIRGLEGLADIEPWHGFGLSASGRVEENGLIAPVGDPTDINNVASDWVLGWWVDGGFLSLPIILLFIYAAIRRLPQAASLLLLLVLLNSLFSNAIALPIPWFSLGLVMSRSTTRMTASEDLVSHFQLSDLPSTVG